MSTRSTTHFLDSDSNEVRAIVYRHTDGYSEGAGVDLNEFLDECATLGDTRFNDATMLAARYCVFLANKFNNRWNLSKGAYEPCESKLDFLSVRIMMEDSADIEYRYTVKCSGGWSGDVRPKVACYSINEGKNVAIPSKKDAA